MLGQLDPYPPVRPNKGFVACTGPNPNIRISAFNSYGPDPRGVMSSGHAPTYERKSSHIYNDFSSINACSGFKSQASYFDLGTYQLST